MELKTSLEQWRTLQAVVDAGGYAPAAEALGKSQSSVSYAIQKLESELNVRLFRLAGRKAVLTDAGQLLLRRAQGLLQEAERIEQAADSLAQGVEAKLSIAVDVVFPEKFLLNALASFAERFAQTRVEIQETALSGTDEALLTREVDLAITPRVPPGFVGEPIMNARFVPVARADHPLHQLGRELSHEDLRGHRQLVVRDSGRRRMDAGWLGAEQRWTFGSFATSIQAACEGLGFSWYPEEKIRTKLDAEELKILPVSEGKIRYVQLYRVYTNGDYAGPAAKAMGEILAGECG